MQTVSWWSRPFFPLSSFVLRCKLMVGFVTNPYSSFNMKVPLQSGTCTAGVKFLHCPKVQEQPHPNLMKAIRSWHVQVSLYWQYNGQQVPASSFWLTRAICEHATSSVSSTWVYIAVLTGQCSSSPARPPKHALKIHLTGTRQLSTSLGWWRCSPCGVHELGRVRECYQSFTAHQHQKGHTVPKQVITIAMSIQVFTV